jgi:hypothetical protein
VAATIIAAASSAHPAVETVAFTHCSSHLLPNRFVTIATREKALDGAAAVGKTDTCGLISADARGPRR